MASVVTLQCKYEPSTGDKSEEKEFHPRVRLPEETVEKFCLVPCSLKFHLKILSLQRPGVRENNLRPGDAASMCPPESHLAINLKSRVPVVPFRELFGAAGASEGLPRMLMTQCTSGLVLQPPAFIVMIFVVFCLTFPKSCSDVVLWMRLSSCYDWLAGGFECLLYL